MKVAIGIVCGAVMLFSPAHAADLFSMSFEEFRATLDHQIRDDTPDKSEANFSTTKQCKKAGNTYTCSFNDKGFQSTVANFKRMDLMNGRFALKMSLTVETLNGKVSKIRLNGDRDDPVNLLQYVGTVTNIMQMFDPEIVEGDGKSIALAKELGLTRGDSDPTIGEPVEVIKPYAAIRCLNVPVQLTSGVACMWMPRS